MAKIGANSMLLWLREVGATDYNNVVCLTSHNLDASRGTNDDNTFCGPDSSQGALTSSIQAQGKTFLNPITNEISAPKMLDWLQDDDIVLEWRRAVADPQNGDWVQEGEGFLSAYNDGYEVDQTGNFGFTLTVKGAISNYIVGESI